MTIRVAARPGNGRLQRAWARGCLQFPAGVILGHVWAAMAVADATFGGAVMKRLRVIIALVVLVNDLRGMAEIRA